MPGARKPSSTWEWRSSFSSSDRISSKLKGARTRDRNADTEAFTSLRVHLKESRARLEEIREASNQYLEAHRNALESMQADDGVETGHANLASWAHLIETTGEKEGGRLGSILQQLGKMQRQLEMQRTAVRVSTQEKLQKSLQHLLDEDYRTTREQKHRLYQARGELEEAAERVKHYRKKIKDGKGGQEAKMQMAIEDLIQAKQHFSALNVDVTRDLAELPVRMELALAQGLAGALAAESQMCAETSRLLRSLGEPLQTFIRDGLGAQGASGAAPADLLSTPATGEAAGEAAGEGEAEEGRGGTECHRACRAGWGRVGAALQEVAEARAEEDREGRLALPRLQALAAGSRVGRVVGREGGMEGGRWRLRAQRPVPGVQEDAGEEGSQRAGAREEGVFGAALEAVPSRRRAAGEGAVRIVEIADELAQPPWLVAELCRLLEARAGGGGGGGELFRRAGDARRVAQARAEVEAGRGDLGEVSDPLDLAALLKAFLHELPQPLVPPQQQRAVVQLAAALPTLRPEQQADRLRAFLASLPQRPAATLHRVVAMLRVVSGARSGRPSPDAAGLALALAPCVSRPAPGTVSVDALMHHASAAAVVLRALIENGCGPVPPRHEAAQAQPAKAALPPQPMSPTASSTHSTVSSHSHSYPQHPHPHPHPHPAASDPRASDPRLCRPHSRQSLASLSDPHPSSHAPGSPSRSHSRQASLSECPDLLFAPHSPHEPPPDPALPPAEAPILRHSRTPSAVSQIPSSLHSSGPAPSLHSSGTGSSVHAGSGLEAERDRAMLAAAATGGLLGHAAGSAGSEGALSPGAAAEDGRGAGGGAGRRGGKQRKIPTNPFESPQASGDEGDEGQGSELGVGSGVAWAAAAGGPAGLGAAGGGGGFGWEQFDSGTEWEAYASPAAALTADSAARAPQAAAPRSALHPPVPPHPPTRAHPPTSPAAAAPTPPLAPFTPPLPPVQADAGGARSAELTPLALSALRAAPPSPHALHAHSPAGPAAHGGWQPPSPACRSVGGGASGSLDMDWVELGERSESEPARPADSAALALSPSSSAAGAPYGVALASEYPLSPIPGHGPGSAPGSRSQSVHSSPGHGRGSSTCTDSSPFKDASFMAGAPDPVPLDQEWKQSDIRADGEVGIARPTSFG